MSVRKHQSFNKNNKSRIQIRRAANRFVQWPLVLHCSKGKWSLRFTYLAASFCSGSVQVSQRSCIIFSPVPNNFGCYAWCVMPAFNSIPTLIHQQNFPPNDACCVDLHSFTYWHRRNACPTCVSQPPAQDCSLNTTLWPGQFQIKDSFTGSRRIARIDLLSCSPLLWK